jgi:hypothetical protein
MKSSTYGAYLLELVRQQKTGEGILQNPFDLAT